MLWQNHKKSHFREFIDEKEVREVEISPPVLNHKDIQRSGGKTISWYEMTQLHGLKWNHIGWHHIKTPDLGGLCNGCINWRLWPLFTEKVFCKSD